MMQRGAPGERSSAYDRFRGRIIFPICNDVGEVIAFSGRLLKDAEGAAKYLNSPETPLSEKVMFFSACTRPSAP